ncbi:hypothetical protein D3C85_384930 [compost metagenome]
MSGSIGRTYLISSWNDAATYSGEMIGERLRSSTQIHFTKDGKANTSLYAEQEKKVKERSAKEQILPQAAALNKLDEQELKLEKEYQDGKIEIAEYEELCYALSLKRERAFKSYMRSIGKYDKWLSEQEAEKQEQNVFYFEQYPVDKQPKQSVNFSQVVKKTIAIASNVCKNMSKTWLEQMKKSWQYGHTKMEFDGQDKAFWLTMVVCSSIIACNII